MMPKMDQSALVLSVICLQGINLIRLTMPTGNQYIMSLENGMMPKGNQYIFLVRIDEV